MPAHLQHLEEHILTYSGKNKYVNPLELSGFLHKLVINLDRYILTGKTECGNIAYDFTIKWTDANSALHEEPVGAVLTNLGSGGQAIAADK